MKKLIPIVSLLIAVSAEAAAPTPSYKDARKLYDEFGKTLSAATLWEKKKPQERAAASTAAMALRDRMEKMWGVPSACAATAIFHVVFITEMNTIVSAGEGVGQPRAFNLLGAMTASEQFGNHRAACYEAVEALDASVKK
jgi:uncharacterized protein YqcC (DUF446 family)